MLEHRGAVRDARVLDLFAGTGALGLEALSRGADHVTFVDNGRAAGRLIAENIRLLEVTAQTRLILREAARLGANDGPMHDLVFLDPPYGKSIGDKALVAAQSGGWIAPGAVVVWEEHAPMTAPPGFEFLETRVLGGTNITLLQADAASAA